MSRSAPSTWDRTALANELQATAAQLRQQHWQTQADAGPGCVTLGDFPLYDPVANHIQLLGCGPARFGFDAHTPEVARYFAMARGLSAHAENHQGCSVGCPPSTPPQASPRWR